MTCFGICLCQWSRTRLRATDEPTNGWELSWQYDWKGCLVPDGEFSPSLPDWMKGTTPLLASHWIVSTTWFVLWYYLFYFLSPNLMNLKSVFGPRDIEMHVLKSQGCPLLLRVGLCEIPVKKLKIHWLKRWENSWQIKEPWPQTTEIHLCYCMDLE